MMVTFVILMGIDGILMPPPHTAILVFVDLSRQQLVGIQVIILSSVVLPQETVRVVHPVLHVNFFIKNVYSNN